MTESERIQKAAVQAFIRSLKGKVFTVLFEKADGSITVRNARAKVLAALADGKDNHANAPVVSFWDNNLKDWRSFNIHRLIRIQCGQRILEGENS